MFSWTIAIFLRTVLAEIFLGAAAYLAWVSIERIRPLPRAIRWLAWATMVQFWITAGFHLLLIVGFFNVTGALAWSAFSAAAAYYFQQNRATTPKALLRQPVLWWRWILGSIRREKLAYLLLPAFVVQTLICLIRPALGYDYLMYHGLKAALWVQQGLHYQYDSPSAWAFYRNFPAGGSVATAWTMLLFHSDRFVSPTCLLYWPLFCLACYALARELGLKSRSAWLVAWFLSSVPAILHDKCEGPIDVPTHAFLIIGIVLAIRSVRERSIGYVWLLGVTGGLTASMKIPSYPCAVILLASPALLLSKVPLAGLIRGWFAGVALCTLLVVPWFYYAYLNTGYPLSPLNVRIGGLVLGTAPASAVAYSHLALPPGSFPWRDIAAFLNMFLTKNPLSLDPYVLVPVALSPLGLAALFRQDWRTALMLAIVVLYYLAFYISPSFTTTRLIFARIDGRFFLTPLLIAVILGYLAAPSFQPALRLFMLLVTVYELNFFAFSFYQPSEIVSVPAFGLIPSFFGLMIALSYLVFYVPFVRQHRLVCTTLVILPVWSLGLSVLGDQCRAAFFEPSSLWPDPFLGAMTLVDNPPRSYKIDITTTKYPSYDGIVALPFMGRELQNQLVYIPISRSGRIYDNTDPHRLDETDFDAWLNRLLEQKVDAVMTFSPRSIEMDWMEEHPELFERLVGGTEPEPVRDGPPSQWRQTVIDPRSAAGWGLYRVIPVSRMP